MTTHGSNSGTARARSPQRRCRGAQQPRWVKDLGATQAEEPEASFCEGLCVCALGLTRNWVPHAALLTGPRRNLGPELGEQLPCEGDRSGRTSGAKALKFNIWTVVVSTGQKGCLGRHQPSDLGHGDGRFMSESPSPISSPPSQVL